MAVNREYWSGSETTTIYDIVFELPLFQGATVSGYEYFDNSFVGKCKKGDINPQDDIDVSYSFCKTDSNFAPCKAKLLCGYSTSYNPASQRGKQYDVSLQGYDIGLGIKEAILRYSTRIQYTSTAPTTLKTTNIPNTNTENKKPLEAYANGNYYYDFSAINLAPVLKVNPRNFMMVIMVNCSKLKEDKSLSDYETEGSLIFNGSERCDLKTYIQHYEPLGYNVITGVWCLLKINPFDNRNVNSGKIGISAMTVDRYSLDYIGSDDDNYIFNAKLPIRGDIYTGSSFKYTTDNDSIIAGSFTWNGYSQQIIAGCLENSSPIYPYEFINIGLGDKFKLYKYNNTYLTATTISDFDNVENFREWCRKQTAYFGLPFRENRDFSNVDENLTDERIMWGIIDSSGITHGEYTTGTNNTKNPLYNSDNLQDDSGWKTGGGGGGDDRYAGSTRLPSKRTSLDAGYQCYKMSVLDMRHLVSQLNSAINSTESELDLKMAFLGNEPYQNILGAKILPFDITYIGNVTSGSAPVFIGNWSSQISAPLVNIQTAVANINWGTKSLDRVYNNFMDYEPYTTIDLILPFTDSVVLPPDMFMGHSVTIESAIDVFANTIVHYIFVDDILYTSVSGNVSFDLPIASFSGMDSVYAQYDIANRKGAIVGQAAQSMLGYVQGAAIASQVTTQMSNKKGYVPPPLYQSAGMVSLAGGAVSAATSLANYLYEKQRADNTKPQPVQVQGSSGNANFSNIQHPILIIKRKQTVPEYNQTVFSSLNGFACDIIDIIGKYTGITKVLNPQLNFKANMTIKNMIVEALSEGIML